MVTDPTMTHMTVTEQMNNQHYHQSKPIEVSATCLDNTELWILSNSKYVE